MPGALRELSRHIDEMLEDGEPNGSGEEHLEPRAEPVPQADVSQAQVY
jgi:hypothetical protein